MRTRVLVAASAAMGLLVSGCGSSDVSAKDWASDVCGSVKSVNKNMETAAKNLKLDFKDLPATQKSFVSMLGTAQTESDKLATAVDEAGTPDVDNGEKVATNLEGKLREASKVFAGAKKKIEGTDASDPKAFAVAFQQVGTDLQEQSKKLGDPAKAIESQPLRTALQNDPGCKSVRG